MIKVLIEQQVLPLYRIPFYERLSQYVDLTLVVSKNAAIPGVSNVTSAKGFKIVRLTEAVYGKNVIYHPNIIKAIEENATQVYVSNQQLLSVFGINSQLRKQLKTTKSKIIYWGCDGYDRRNFKSIRFKKTLLYKLLHPKLWLTILKQDTEREAIRLADGFIAYSTYTSKFWQNVWGIPVKKITVAHNAVDTSPMSLRLRDNIQNRIERGNREIVFVGRMTEGKGIELLLSAFRTIKMTYPDATLILVGGGPAKEKLVNLSHQLELTDVKFMGEVTDQNNLAALLCHASVFVLPGLGGLGLNSAMASGLPIICTEADGTELDLVKENINGWFFNKNDSDDLTKKLNEALAEPGRLRKFGNQSTNFIEEKFNLANMVSKFVERVTITYNL